MKHSIFLAVFFLGFVLAASGQWQPQSAHVNLYFPHLTDGGPPAQQWQTTFTFVNVSEVTANVNLWLYDNNGDPLSIDFGSGPVSEINLAVPPNGTTILRSQMASSIGVSGWAYGESDVPVQAAVAFRMIQNGVPQQELSAQPTLPTLTYTSPAGAYLGVALANPYIDTEVYVLLSLYDATGVLVAGPARVTIPVNGHVSFNLVDFFPVLGTNRLFRGMLYMEGEDPTFPDRFLAWTLNTDGSIMSTLPPGDFPWPISHWDKIWRVWSIVNDAARGLDDSFSTPDGVGLNILFTQQVNAFTNGSAEVDISVAVSELIGDSESELAFALAHQLGHIYQLRNGNQLKFGGNAESDADQWAMAILLAARYDPYAAAGTLAKLAMATNASQLTTQYDGQAAAAANISLNARLSGLYAAIQQACAVSPSTVELCATYKGVVHPGLPPTAPLRSRRGSK